MFIERIDVERFGKLSRTTIEGLGPGVQVLYGTNETGKTTLLEFVRAGVGITIINPFPMSLRKDPEIRFIPFRPGIAYETSFVLPSMSPPSAVARRFIDFVRSNQQEDGYSRAIRTP